MGKLIIDAHSHLWLKQDTVVDGKRILSLKNGRSIFMDEEVQMLPPFMIDGQNTAEVFLSNMNYAQVGGAVVVQEVIDGCQNAYLTKVQHDYPNRFFCMGMAWNTDEAQAVIDLNNRLRSIAIYQTVAVPCAVAAPFALLNAYSANPNYGMPNEPRYKCDRPALAAIGYVAAAASLVCGIMSYVQLWTPRLYVNQEGLVFRLDGKNTKYYKHEFNEKDDE